MRVISFLLFFLISLFAVEVSGQKDWKLQKQQDGIRIYTAHQEDTRILAYRIEALIHGALKDVYHQVIDFQGNKKYLETVKQIDVLKKEPDQQVLFYMLFDLPWPIRDRDFVNRMDIRIGSDTIALNSSPASGWVEPNEQVVRMQEFSEQWLLVRKNSGKTSLSLEGYADPGGKFPAWVVNRFVVKEPHALVRGIKQQVESKRGS
ncbi:MAG: hypothetical protein KGY60_06580 [Bacteroidales bacterium]|nr:hypothetical protein [Bacteroidales bacterium]